MRLAAIALGLAACSVPEKQPTDAGGDGPLGGSGPDTTITEAPPEFSDQGFSTFRFTSSDPAARFECSVDGDTPQPCTAPFTRSLGDGQHGFSVRAFDGAGNGDDTPAEHVWSIDTVTPDTAIEEGPPSSDNSVMVRFTFGSGEANVAFECSLDNAAYAPCVSGASLGPLGEGAHAFAVRARDRAGNVDASPAIRAWTIDTSTPDTQLLSGPPESTAATSATFTFISPDAGPGAAFQCALDGGAFAPCTSPRELTGLTGGEHTFAVRVRDLFGNLDPTPATWTWTVDLGAPETSIEAGPSGAVAMASVAFAFTANETGAAFACSLDAAPFAACTSPFTAAGLAQGAHTFAVRASDRAGHTDATPATRGWTVDTVAPDIEIVSGPVGGDTTGPRVAFGFTTTEGALTCSLDEGPFTACTSPFGFNAAAGAHQLRVRATDPAGNTAVLSRGWTVACVAPEPTGAVALLHLDDTGQALANAVTGGAEATLGDDLTVEARDPTVVSAGRFGGALAFNAAEADRISWPIALPDRDDVAIEVWARPDAAPGSRDVVITRDGDLALRVSAASPSTVEFSVAVVERGAVTRVATAAAVSAGTWHHVIAALHAPMLRLWVDGDLVEVAASPDKRLKIDVLRVGGNYSGQLDELWLAQTAIVSSDAALARYCPL